VVDWIQFHFISVVIRTVDVKMEQNFSYQLHMWISEEICEMFIELLIRKFPGTQYSLIDMD
jgi:hypothetical protein